MTKAELDSKGEQSVSGYFKAIGLVVVARIAGVLGRLIKTFEKRLNESESPAVGDVLARVPKAAGGGWDED